MSDKICKKCGRRISQDAKFCPLCGCRTEATKRRRKSNEISVLPIVITFIIIAIVCALVIFILMTRDTGITFNTDNKRMVKDEMITTAPTATITSTPAAVSPSPKAAPSASPTAAPVSKAYKNSRYGFSVKYPAKVFTSSNTSDNGDGIALSGSNISASVFGINNVFHESLDERYEDTLNTYSGISYKVKKDNFYIISGTDRGEIYYMKEYVGRESINTLLIKYPSSKKKNFDAAVTELANSFSPGDLANAH